MLILAWLAIVVFGIICCAGDHWPKTQLKLIRAPRGTSTLGILLLIVLVLALVGALPAWPHSAGWGYFPSGGVGLLLVIVLVLLIADKL